ncbi:MAG: complex I NDUFA9 subunit family protein [Halapricum sp.]
MNVLVTGGDGFVGRHLCTELIERDHDVTSLSRNPDPSVLPEDVETATGDVTDGEGITHAFEGIDAVVNLVALSPLFTPSGGDEMHERIHLGGTENVVAAAEAHDVDRIVQMSALGADPHGPTHYIRAKGKAEEVVRESDLQSVIVRPSVIFGDGGEFVSFTKRLKKLFAPGVPVYPLPGGGKKTRFQPIWVGDLAPMLASTVEDDDRAGETYELGGPEILTLREVTEAVYESEGRSIKIVSLPMGLAGVGLKTLSVVPGFPMGGDQYRSLQFDNTTDDNDVGAFDVDPDELTSLREYLGSA